MPINSAFPEITMPLFETDERILQEFIENERIEKGFSEKYLILYDFATDCIYPENISPELIRFLLPYYQIAIEQAALGNLIAGDIYCAFNSAVFINQKSFMYALGEKNYKDIMEYYVEQTLTVMKTDDTHLHNWASLFNTTVAFCKDNISLLMQRCLRGPISIKHSFLKYLSVLLFKEGDNLLAQDELRPFWTNCVLSFDSYISDTLYWSDDIIEYFDREIVQDIIVALFDEVKSMLVNSLGADIVCLISEEIENSFASGVFQERKAEYLKKMNCKSEKCKYWYNY
jgi:hypothetical protein